MSIDWVEFFSRHIKDLEPGRNEWAKGKCPFHDDKRDSLSLNKKNGAWKCFAGCGKGSAKDLCERLRIDYPPARRGKSKSPQKAAQKTPANLNVSSSNSKIIVTYIYTDEQEKPLFRKHRTADKKFWVERPDGKGGWILGLAEARAVPYFLPEVIKAERVCCVEGEKDVHTLRVLGFAATTAPFGADSWPEHFAELFKGKDLVIFRDNDNPGRRYQLEAAVNCFPVAKSIRLIELPGLKEKEDVTDWCHQHHKKEDLLKIISQTAPLTKEDLPRLQQELAELKGKTQGKVKKPKTGLEILMEGEPPSKLHSAMAFVDGVLLYGFRYGEEHLWITSKGEILNREELQSSYGEPRGLPMNEGPSQHACDSYRQGKRIDGVKLHEMVAERLIRHVAFKYPWHPRLLATWVMATYFSELFPVFPMLHVTSRDKRCGKSTLLDVTSALCFGRPVVQTSPTEAVLFREPLNTAQPLFWDEAEGLYKLKRDERDDRIAILNHGWRKGGVVKRVDKNTYEIHSFPVYRPMVLCGISRLPDTTSDRCLKIELERRRSSDSVKPFHPSRIERDLRALRDGCYAFALAHAADIADAYRVPDGLPLPDGLDDRLREIMEPLFAVAAVIERADAHGPVTKSLIDAANHLSGQRREEEQDRSAAFQVLGLLIEKSRTEGDPWIATTAELVKLFKENGLDWIESPRQAQRLLNHWGLRSATHRRGGDVARGYRIEHQALKEHAERYAPDLLATSVPPLSSEALALS